MLLSDPIFSDADKAREHLEATRWPNGPVCPHCGVVDQATNIGGKAARAGCYQCNACREQFTVTVGTVFERSKVPLNKWLLASFLMASSKKGISAHQIGRSLGVTYKTAWFMCHRLRAAMDPIYNAPPTPMGGARKTIEMDETYIGNDPSKPRPKGARGFQHKMAVFALVERGGSVRSFHIDNADQDTVRSIVRANVHPHSKHYTDGGGIYRENAMRLRGHDWVDHGADEYVRGDVHTNTIEGFFSIFKRGMKGVYQHCSEKHLARYLAEFDFRYNNREKLGVNDMARTANALKGAKGKRLTYRRLDWSDEAPQ